MSLVEIFKNFLNKYMRNSVDKMDVPEFSPDEEKRYQIIFSGTVQGVGFRYETWLIADKLGLTGFAKNLANGDVLVEVQGSKNKIMYLIQCMKSIRRIYIENMEMEELPLKEEKEFTPVY